MNPMWKMVVLISSSVYLFSCSSPSQFIMPEYKNRKIQLANMVVAIPFKVHVFNGDDVIDDLGSGVPEEVYFNFMKSRLLLGLKKYSHIQRLDYAYTENKSLVPRLLEVNKGRQMKIQLPLEGKAVIIDSLDNNHKLFETHFVLFINNFMVNRATNQPGTFTHNFTTQQGQLPNTTYSGGKAPGIVHQLDYAVWDNTTGKLVGYGVAKSQSNILFAMTKEDWESGLEELTKQILKNLPFKNEYFYK